LPLVKVKEKFQIILPVELREVLPLENRCQFRHFQHYLTGLIVLDNKSLANITRCVLESADKTNLSRFFSEAPWFQDRVNDRRLTYLLQQTQAVRGPKADGALILE